MADKKEPIKKKIGDLSGEEKNIIERHRREKEHQEFIDQFKFRIRAMYKDSQTIDYRIFNIEEIFKNESFLRGHTIIAIDRFSGYKYKDGKNIFEEDVVFDTANDKIAKITFDLGCFNVCYPNEDGSFDCERLDDLADCLEFQGISYDNPKWNKVEKQEGDFNSSQH